LFQVKKWGVEGWGALQVNGTGIRRFPVPFDLLSEMCDRANLTLFPKFGKTVTGEVEVVGENEIRWKRSVANEE